MKSITGIAKKIIGHNIIIEQIMIYNHMNDLNNFEMCLSDLHKDTELYGLNSDWYATYMYTSEGTKRLVALTCLNLNHPEFAQEGENTVHLSAIEVDPKYRDSILEVPLHAFSLTIKALKAAAKKAGYSLMTLQAKDLDKVPKYKHLGFSIIDLSDMEDYNKNLDFYSEHPLMSCEL